MFQLNPSAPSFITSRKPTGIEFFGKPSGPISSQPTNPVAAPSFNTARPALYSPFSDLNKPETKPGPFSNLNKLDITPGPFSDPNRQDSTVPTFTTSGSTGQAHQDPPSMASPSKSIFDAKSDFTASSTKMSFGTSPLFSQNEPRKSAQPEKKDVISAFSSAASAQPAADDIQPSGSPFDFLNHAKPVAPSSTLPPQAPTNNVEKVPAQRSLPPPFSSSLSPNAPASGSPFRSPQQSDQPDTGLNFDVARPITTPSTTFLFPQSKNAVKPPEQPIDQTAPATTIPTFRTQQLTSTQSQPSDSAVEPPEAAVATPPPDPRPAVLDALAESLMMDDQGLLQQFIEYTVGPIVHHAFLEVEDDRSWHRASQWLIEERVMGHIELTCEQEKFVLPCSAGNTLGAGRTTCGQRNSCGKAKSEEQPLHNRCNRWQDHHVRDKVTLVSVGITENPAQQPCKHRTWALHPHHSRN